MGFESAGINGVPKNEREPGLRDATAEEIAMVNQSLSNMEAQGFKRPYELRRYLTDLIASTSEMGFKSKAVNEEMLATYDELVVAVEHREGQSVIDAFRNRLPTAVFNTAVELASPDNPNQSMYRHSLSEGR